MMTIAPSRTMNQEGLIDKDRIRNQLIERKIVDATLTLDHMTASLRWKRTWKDSTLLHLSTDGVNKRELHI